MSSEFSSELCQLSRFSKIKRSFQDVKRDFELACQFHNLLEQRVSPETHSTLGRVSL